MSSERPTEGKRKHKEDNFASFNYQCLDDFICSDKENVKAFDNIDDLVDSILAKSKVTSYERHVKDIKRIRSFDKKRSAKRSKGYDGVGPIFGMSDLVSVKKLFSIVLSFVLLFAVLASASSFVDPDLDVTSVNPEDMLVEDNLSSNATISDANHTNGTMDEESLFDNSTFPSDQNGIVTVDNESMMNENGDTMDNDTFIGENESLNESIPHLDDIANETASINTLFIVNDITDETDDVTVLSLVQGEAVVGESVFWEKKIMVKNNASIQRTLNIVTTIPDAVSNIKIQDVSEGNEVNYTVLVNQIVENNVSEQISSSTSIMFNRAFDAWDEGEFIITYETPAPIKQEISYDGGKRIEIQSNATVHYSNVTAYTELPELSYKPRFYRVINGTRVDVTFDPLYNVAYLDNNSNGKYDGISWNVPRLSNDTYEVLIVITKAAHLDENRGFISDIYNEVYRKDGVWSEPIYHDEYIRVTFERNLTERNDITFYARNNQSLNTIVEVYYYDSDEKITEFPIITQERYYKVFLTGMTGAHDVFDLRIKNLDNENSAYLEFDYILDPSLPYIESWEVVLEPNAGADGITIPKPDGTVENDLLVAIIVLDGADIVGCPAGFQHIAIQTATGMGATAFYKVATGSEPADYSFTWTNEQSVSGMLRISGANVSGEVINVNDTGSATSGDPVCPDITTTVDNCLILRFIGIDDDDNGDNFGCNPDGHEHLWSRASSASSSSCSGGAAYENLTSKGSAGIATWSITSEAEGWASFSIAIAPLAETVNSAPTQTGESPTNQSTGVNTTPALYVICNDADGGDTLTATWRSNSSGAWVDFATNTSISPTTNITQTNSNFSNYSVTYYWSVNVTDETDWCNETYHFTTEAIDTSVDTITPYNVTSSTLTINATGPSNLDNVTLWYRYSSDNSSWEGWMENITDTEALWQWSFNFSNANATGYYEFYSIGNKSGSPNETAPGTADAICLYLPFNVSPSTWPLGNVLMGGSDTSTDYYFNLTNEGNVTLNIQINASNATNLSTGAQWNLTSTPGHNDFTLHYDKSGDGGWTIINTTYDTFVTDLVVDDYQTFDLRMTHATTSSVFDPMSFNVTFKSVVS